MAKEVAVPKPLEDEPKLVCGLIMPLSHSDGYSETHWQEVKEIFSQSIIDANFEPHMVSDAPDTGVILKRILENLYTNNVVVCDVSSNNPNVMFELGIRLTFDKPTILVKDEKTNYSFDVSSIEHLDYPSDLRYPRVVDFKKELSEKIQATHKKSQTDPEYSTFLKSFGDFTTPKLNTREVSKETFLLEGMQQMREEFQQLRKAVMPTSSSRVSSSRANVKQALCLHRCTAEVADQVVKEILQKMDSIFVIETRKMPNGHTHLIIDPASIGEMQKILSLATPIVPLARLQQ